MLEAMYFTLASDLTTYHRTGQLPERRGDKTPANTAPYGRYRCKDGWIALICVSEAQWERLLRVVGRDELIGNPDYDAREKRHVREVEINAMIEDWSNPLPRDEAFAILRENRIPVAPIRNLEDVRNDPHMHARGTLHRMQHPAMGDIVLPRAPIRLSEFDAVPLEFFPEPGANAGEVLRDWLGLGEDEIADLRQEAVI
jgi:crotonobetainyl-CoA:carnitine CoA-transferase CaiB-like acyl-CoA transferase